MQRSLLKKVVLSEQAFILNFQLLIVKWNGVVDPGIYFKLMKLFRNVDS